MSDDTRRILDLLAQGKITVDEADQLLRAMSTSSDAAQTAAAASNEPSAAPRYVRITVHKTPKDKTAKDDCRDKDVNIRVPIAVVRSGMRLGALIPGFPGDAVSARLRERGIDVDFSKLDTAALEHVLKQLGDTNIEVDSGKARVRISCE
jgi:SHOCT-like protein